MLNIPKPNLNSFFDVDSIKNETDSASDSGKIGSFCRPKTAGPFSSAATDVLNDNKSEDDNSSTVDTNDAANGNAQSTENCENPIVEIERSSPPPPPQPLKPIIATNFGRKSLINDEISTTPYEDSNEPSKRYNRPKTSFQSRLSRFNKENDVKKRPHSSYIAKNINQVSGGLIEIVNNNIQHEQPRIVYSANKVVNNNVDQDFGIVGKKYTHKNKREAPCCTLKEGYWKYDLLNRG